MALIPVYCMDKMLDKTLSNRLKQARRACCNLMLCSAAVMWNAPGFPRACCCPELGLCTTDAHHRIID
eukprot:6473409-Amphidinium_carterae.1